MTQERADASGDIGEEVDYKNELLRKAIHMCSLSIPIAYIYLPWHVMLMILVPATALVVTADMLRSVNPFFFRLYRRMFGSMLRRHEISLKKWTLNGASWVLISALFCVLVFPRIIAVTALAVLIISDTVAALVGRRFGTWRFNDKSLQGSAAFVLSAFCVIALTPKIAGLWSEYLIAAIAAVIGAVAEVFSFGIIDDNFAIPVAIGCTLWLLYLLVLPGIDIHIFDLP